MLSVSVFERTPYTIRFKCPNKDSNNNNSKIKRKGKGKENENENENDKGREICRLHVNVWARELFKTL